MMAGKLNQFSRCPVNRGCPAGELFVTDASTDVASFVGGCFWVNAAIKPTFSPCPFIHKAFMGAQESRRQN
jgi:hypothetical protein